MKKIKYAIVYLNIEPNYAKLHNLPVKLPILAEDFYKAKNENKIPLDIIIRGLEAQINVKKDEYYSSYLVYHYYEMFKQLMNKEDFELAYKYLLKAKEILHDYRFHFYSGLYYAKLGNEEIAELELKQSISEKKDFAYGYFELGNLMYFRKIYDEAVDYYIKAIESDKEFSLAYLKIGDIFAENGRYEQAIENYFKVIKLDSQFIPVYQRLGVIYNQLERYKDAYLIHKKALEIDRNNYEIYYNNSYSLSKLGRHLDAIKNLEKALTIKETDFILHELSLEYKNIGEFIKAINAEEKALKLSSDENKNLIYLTLLKLYTIIEDEENVIKNYNELKNTDLQIPSKSLLMFFYLSKGDIENTEKILSELNKEGLFLSLPLRLDKIDTYLEKLESYTDLAVEKALLESFDDDGMIDAKILSEKLSENGLKGEYIGWLKEPLDKTSKLKPLGLKVIINALYLSGFNYGLSERVESTLSKYLWKDNYGLAFSKVLLRYYQNRVFGEQSNLENFIEEIIEEIKDLNYKFSKIISEYETYILDFDSILESNMKTFEDALYIFLSAMRFDLSIEEIENQKFKNEEVKDLIMFVAKLNRL